MGFDEKTGRPVICEHATLVDPEHAFEMFQVEGKSSSLVENFLKRIHVDLINFHIFVMERDLMRTIESSKKRNKGVTQTVVVQNIEGLGWNHMNNKAFEVLKVTLLLSSYLRFVSKVSKVSSLASFRFRFPFLVFVLLMFVRI